MRESSDIFSRVVKSALLALAGPVLCSSLPGWTQGAAFLVLGGGWFALCWFTEKSGAEPLNLERTASLSLILASAGVALTSMAGSAETLDETSPEFWKDISVSVSLPGKDGKPETRALRGAGAKAAWGRVRDSQPSSVTGTSEPTGARPRFALPLDYKYAGLGRRDVFTWREDEDTVPLPPVALDLPGEPSILELGFAGNEAVAPRYAERHRKPVDNAPVKFEGEEQQGLPGDLPGEDR